jgi:hypothetical protein
VPSPSPSGRTGHAPESAPRRQSPIPGWRGAPRQAAEEIAAGQALPGKRAHLATAGRLARAGRASGTTSDERSRARAAAQAGPHGSPVAGDATARCSPMAPARRRRPVPSRTTHGSGTGPCPPHGNSRQAGAWPAGRHAGLAAADAATRAGPGAQARAHGALRTANPVPVAAGVPSALVPGRPPAPARHRECPARGEPGTPFGGDRTEPERLRTVAVPRRSCRQRKYSALGVFSLPLGASRAETLTVTAVLDTEGRCLRINRPPARRPGPTESPQVRVLRGDPHKLSTDDTAFPGTRRHRC